MQIEIDKSNKAWVCSLFFPVELVREEPHLTTLLRVKAVGAWAPSSWLHRHSHCPTTRLWTWNKARYSTWCPIVPFFKLLVIFTKGLILHWAPAWAGCLSGLGVPHRKWIIHLGFHSRDTGVSDLEYCHSNSTYFSHLFLSCQFRKEISLSTACKTPSVVHAN